MHPYLDWLGINPQIQTWLAPSFQSDAAGNILFKYGNETEIYGIGFHRLPANEEFWQAGAQNIATVKKVIICTSAMEAIAWLHFHAPAFTDLDSLLLLSTGSALTLAKRARLSALGKHKSYVLATENSLLGAVMDLSIAAAIRRKPISIRHDAEYLDIFFRNQAYRVQAEHFSLNAFSKQAGFRFRCGTSKPTDHLNWLQLLLAEKNH